MTTQTIEHMRRIATPSRLAMEIGKKVTGFDFELFHWLEYAEQRILDAVMDTERRFIILNVPPRSGKTSYSGLFLPAWYLGMFPGKRVMFVSYSDDFSVKWGRGVRTILDKFGREYFGVGVDRSAQAASNWQMAGSFGGMLSTGIGGVLTGEGGDLIICVTGDMEVRTNFGPMSLAEAVNAGYDDLHVLSFDHTADHSEWRRVSGTRSTVKSNLVEIVTEAGRRLTCTDDHLVWVEGRGYRKAGLLEAGWRVRCLSGVRDADHQKEQRQTVRPVLRSGPQVIGDVRVLELREGSSRDAGGSSQEAAPSLLQSVQSRTFGGGAPTVETDMPLWGHHPAQEPHVLFGGMPETVGRHGSAANCQEVPEVQCSVSSLHLAHDLLLAGVCECGTFGSDERQRQLSLPARPELHVGFHQAAPRHYEDGRACLCRVPLREKAGSTPHRLEPAEQHDLQSCNALSSMSHEPPQVDTDTILLVRYLHEGPRDVYDLTVEGAHNFFANGILVHNCDDVIKNIQEAKSQATKRMHEDWWDSTLFTRLEPGGTIIITATRWAEDDLSGVLIDRMRKPGYSGPQWEVLDFPALA